MNVSDDILLSHIVDNFMKQRKKAELINIICCAHYYQLHQKHQKGTTIPMPKVIAR